MFEFSLAKIHKKIHKSSISEDNYFVNNYQKSALIYCFVLKANA